MVWSLGQVQYVQAYLPHIQHTPLLGISLISSKSLFWRNFRSEAKVNSVQFALLPMERPVTEGFHSLLSHINSGHALVTISISLGFVMRSSEFAGLGQTKLADRASFSWAFVFLCFAFCCCFVWVHSIDEKCNQRCKEVWSNLQM